MADVVKQMVQIIAKQFTLGNQVVKSADAASVFRRECGEIKYNTIKLLDVLRQAAVRVSFMYERPTRRIIEEIEVVLLKAYVLVRKCGSSYCFINRLFTIGPAASFRKISARMENSIGDVSWLLRFSAPVKDRWDEYVGLPPIAVYDPVLCLIWEQIAILCNGSVNEKSDAAASLVLLARDSDWYAWMIVKEGGVGPLLKLMEWKPEAQEIAARAIALDCLRGIRRACM